MASIGILLFIFPVLYISVGNAQKGKFCHNLRVCSTKWCSLLTGLLILFLKNIFSSTAFVNVQCKTENVGQYGQKSLLECVVKTSEDVADPQIRLVSWGKEGAEEALLVFYRGTTKQLSGYSLAEPSWNDRNMNVSLLITNTAVQDEGVYTCNVLTNIGDGFSHTRLNLTGKPSAMLTAETFGTDSQPF